MSLLELHAKVRHERVLRTFIETFACERRESCIFQHANLLPRKRERARYFLEIDRTSIENRGDRFVALESCLKKAGATECFVELSSIDIRASLHSSSRRNFGLCEKRRVVPINPSTGGAGRTGKLEFQNRAISRSIFLYEVENSRVRWQIL